MSATRSVRHRFPGQAAPQRKITLHSYIRYVPCEIEDDSGRVAVDLDGAEIEAPQVVYSMGLPAANAGVTVLTR